jgi:hypothetical protein
MIYYLQSQLYLFIKVGLSNWAVVCVSVMSLNCMQLRPSAGTHVVNVNHCMDDAM